MGLVKPSALYQPVLLASKDGPVRELRVRIKNGDKWRLAAAQGTPEAQPASK